MADPPRDPSHSSELELLHLAAIVQWSDDAILSKDLDGIILSWNTGAERLYGYTREEVVGRHVSLLIPEGLLDDVERIMSSIRRGERVEHYETRRRRKDGQVIHVSVSVSPLRTAAGVIIGASAIARDITGRVQTEEAIREQARILEASNRRLQHLNQELERFAYVTSHDLREPLRTINAYAELLRQQYRGRLDPDADEIIDFVVSGTQRMDALIQDLLAHSRAGRLDSREHLDAGEVLHDVLADLTATRQDRHAEVTSDPLPGVFADRTDLQHLFQNLLENAIKFSHREPRVHVTGRVADGWAIFSVRDNGVGIEPEHRGRVFELFQRLRPKDFPGTGVGLALCQKVVQAYGGRIWVDDAEGGGSVFTFTLPASRQPRGSTRGTSRKP